MSMNRALWFLQMDLSKRELACGVRWLLTTSLPKGTLFWGTVPQRLVDGWQAQAGDQIISQIEAYAALLVRWHFRARWKGRKSLVFHRQ